MRRFIVAGTGLKAGDLGVIAMGIEWLSGGICALYWPRNDVTSNYPSIIEVRKNIENDHIKVLWTDHEHIPANNNNIISITELS